VELGSAATGHDIDKQFEKGFCLTGFGFMTKEIADIYGNYLTL